MNEEILSDVKILLGLEDESKDKILNFYINDIENAILSYCRIDCIPNQLFGLIAQIVTKLFNEENNKVTSITEGDRKIEYADRCKIIIEEYYKRLKPFRNISSRLPSEVI